MSKETCPDCKGLGFIAEGYFGDDYLPCHFCGTTGRVDMDAYLTDVFEAAQNVGRDMQALVNGELLNEDIPDWG